MMPKRVIVDVDVGTDDAMALLLFLFAEVVGMIKIEAITCVGGNTALDDVATNVLRLLEAANRTDIPVYKGAESSFIPPEVNGDGFHGRDGFGDLTWPRKPDLTVIQGEIASIAMGRIVSENPGEITIIGLGPVTNIALAIKLYPNFVHDVESVHLMGGNYKAIGNIQPAAEFNFYMDPEAIFILLENAQKLVHILTWESVRDTTISPNWRFKTLGVIKNPVLDIITRADRTIYPSKAKYYGPADAFLAAAFLFPETIIKVQETFPASVELHGTQTRGQVVINHANDTIPNAIFIEKVDQEFFKNVLIYASTATSKSFQVKKQK